MKTNEEKEEALDEGCVHYSPAAFLNSAMLASSSCTWLMFLSLSSATRETLTHTHTHTLIRLKYKKINKQKTHTKEAALPFSLFIQSYSETISHADVTVPVLAVVQFCPSTHDLLPGSALHNNPSLSSAAQWTP